jgi:hypothetical protein
MTARSEDYAAALDAAAGHARRWLESVPTRAVPTRAVPPRVSADELRTTFGERIPDCPSSAAKVVDTLAEATEPGLMAIASGRFFGWVMGATLPTAFAADWLVSTWDRRKRQMKVSLPTYGQRYRVPDQSVVT